MYFDTHAHYDNGAFKTDRDEVLRRLPALGVGLVLCPGCDMESSAACAALAREYGHVYAAVGVHPHEAQHVPEDYLDRLRGWAAEPKVMAIGEIGLDYYYNHSPREVQKRVFHEQMELAEELGLPVIVHNREAHADCLEVVKSHPGVVRGVYHCYSGGVEDARTLVDMGWYLSFTGSITFSNARRALEVIADMPADRIMIETDAPYLTPVPFRGKRNDSGYVPIVAETVARVRGISDEEAARLTKENGKRFFGIV